MAETSLVVDFIEMKYVLDNRLYLKELTLNTDFDGFTLEEIQVSNQSFSFFYKVFTRELQTYKTFKPDINIQS